METVNKSKNERLDRIASKYEKDIRDGLLAAFNAIKDVATLNVLETAIVTGGVTAVLNVLSPLESIIGKHVKDSLFQAVAESGRMVVSFLPANSVVDSFYFNIIDPNMIKEFNNHFVRFVSDTTLSTKRAIVQNLEANMIAGNSPIKAARDIRSVIGLNDVQEQAVRNYRQALESKDKKALKRLLRDKRFDSPVRAGKQLPQEKIDRMVERYKARQLKYRAEMIARTEALRGVSMGEYEGLKQAFDSGSLRVNVLRFWSTAKDERVRYSHTQMPIINKNGVPINGAFKTPRGFLLRYPRDPQGPPEETINCRCHVLYQVSKKTL